MKGLSQTATLFSFILYPIVLLLRWVLLLLYWLASPFIFMGRLTKEIANCGGLIIHSAFADLVGNGL